MDQYCFARWRLSSVFVVCHLSSVTLPAGGRAGWPPGAWTVDTPAASDTLLFWPWNFYFIIAQLSSPTKHRTPTIVSLLHPLRRVFVRRTRLSTVGYRAFPVDFVRIWITLSQHATSASSLTTNIRARLKTYPFTPFSWRHSVPLVVAQNGLWYSVKTYYVPCWRDSFTPIILSTLIFCFFLLVDFVLPSRHVSLKSIQVFTDDTIRYDTIR